MNTFCHAARLPVLVVALAAAASHGEETPNVPLVPPSAEAELRSVITRGLGYLGKAGDQWMEEKNCNSCHHMPLLLWGHREARTRGFTVDARKYDGWLAWSIERAADKKPGLEEAALMILALPERPAPELVKLLAAEQQPDGSWKPAGQFATMQKRGAADAQANSTRLCLLALGSAQSAKLEADGSMLKAGAVLQKNDTPTSMESLVFRTLYARRFGKPDESTALIRHILKNQRGDGGWSSCMGENMSDPLATGQALYVLQTTRADCSSAEAVARAQRWLRRMQRADGSWLTDITHISKMDRSAPEKEKSFKAAMAIYEYWGSAWAVIGLLQGVPVK